MNPHPYFTRAAQKPELATLSLSLSITVSCMEHARLAEPGHHACVTNPMCVRQRASLAIDALRHRLREYDLSVLRSPAARLRLGG